MSVTVFVDDDFAGSSQHLGAGRYNLSGAKVGEDQPSVHDHRWTWTGIIGEDQI